METVEGVSRVSRWGPVVATLVAALVLILCLTVFRDAEWPAAQPLKVPTWLESVPRSAGVQGIWRQLNVPLVATATTSAAVPVSPPAVSRSSTSFPTVPSWPYVADSRGVVYAAGGPYLNLALRSVRRLRAYGCHEAVCFVGWGAEEHPTAEQQQQLAELEVKFVDASTVSELPPNVEWRGYPLKVLAVYLMPWQHILLLDADTWPLCDWPQQVWHAPEYAETGAVFWPDVVDHENFSFDQAVWRLLGLRPLRDRWQQESSCVAIDRARHDASLQQVLTLNVQHRRWYHYMHGDKDTWRIGCALAGRPYHMVVHEPGALVTPSTQVKNFVQYQPNGLLGYVQGTWVREPDVPRIQTWVPRARWEITRTRERLSNLGDAQRIPFQLSVSLDEVDPRDWPEVWSQGWTAHWNYLHRTTEYVSTVEELQRWGQPVDGRVWLRMGSHLGVRRTDLGHWVRHVLPSLHTPFVLVTSDGDTSVPEDVPFNVSRAILQNPWVKAWYAQNADPTAHPKIHGLPIGFNWHVMPQVPFHSAVEAYQCFRNAQALGLEETIEKDRTNNSTTKPRIRGVWMDVQHAVNTRLTPHRALLRRYLQRQSLPSHFRFDAQRLNQADTWERYATHEFVLSLPGNGWDCHRTYEALALGAVVVTVSTPLNLMLREAPVIILDEEEWWKELQDYEGLVRKRQALPSLPEGWLTRPYWVARMQEHVTLSPDDGVNSASGRVASS